MTGARKIRIVCIDDHKEIRRLFELLLRDHAEIEVVGTLSSAEDLKTHVETLDPNVIILDISMPGPSPLQAMKEVKESFPTVHFLVSSSYDDQRTISNAMNAGATGYLVKEGLFDELVQAIRVVARGEPVLPARSRRV